MDKSTTRFVVSVVGLALSAAVLILLLPPAVTSDTPPHPVLLVALSAVVVAFGVATRQAGRQRR